MKSSFQTAAAALVVLVLGQASGNASEAIKAGEKEFRKCKSCHMIQDGDGNKIVKGGKIGPNLYGVNSRRAGTVDGAKYSGYMIAAGEAGLVWTEDDFVPYVANPTDYLRKYLDDDSARAKMTFRLPKAAAARNVWAYLVSVGPAPN